MIKVNQCFKECILIPNRAIYEHLLLHYIPSARMSRDLSLLCFPNGFYSEEGVHKLNITGQRKSMSNIEQNISLNTENSKLVLSPCTDYSNISNSPEPICLIGQKDRC